ncbi:alpha-galactosidase A precursor [Penicillium longicatenatum]|uniref:alpha-galactosidase A precursor n=1 Tax=Penicillium longicatenatum TaxID=1561947 RepID=UPI00254715FE|nr:alpha-galactosidase A precursor [Penicillium longicatenatum]KAJ5658551.1 alpha-galactosidase A precursor [Penicillium longicatenatum]
MTEKETTAYQWISGHKIGHQFLGNVAEHDRWNSLPAYGVLLLRIEACKEVLSRLHKIGVRHRETHRVNFLIRDSKATLIDFDTAQGDATIVTCFYKSLKT